MTQQMQVGAAGMGFLLDRLGKDCPKLQYLRELTQNSFEAFIRYPEITGDRQIIWARDNHWFDQTGVSKLCVIDNGIGMTPEEMIGYVNALSSSGGTQSFQGNYGIGAKIAAATYHPYGVIYQSWKDGKGYMIWLWRDPKSGAYGLKEYPEDTQNTSSAYVYELGDDDKPSIIKDHGTKVILLGSSAAEDTFNPADEVLNTWVPRYLNTRYFKLPADIHVKSEAVNAKDNRTISGMAKYLKEKSGDKSGIVKLDDVKLHWWILPKGLGDSRAFLDKGHVAAIHQNELYEIASGKRGIGKLSQFGIIFGANRVVIYAEPLSHIEVHTNTSRSGLQLNGEELPWGDWASEFSKNIPDAIKELQEEERGDSPADHADDVRRLLSSIKNFFDLTKNAFRKGCGVKGEPVEESEEEDISMGDEGLAGSGGSNIGTTRGRRSGIRSKSGGGEDTDNPYVKFKRKENGEGHKSSPMDSPFPKVQWINNPEEYGLEGLAAIYHQTNNTIIMNRNFGGFIDLREKLSAQTSLAPALAAEAIKSSMEKWYELSLIEAVVGINSMKNLAKWNPEQMKTALSPEALTTVCMQRYYPLTNIKREIGKFKLKTE